MKSILSKLFHSGRGSHEAPREPRVGERMALVHWLDTTPVDSKDKPCTLRSLSVEARVHGVYAKVTQTMEIHNPNNRDLSASVSVPLPDRATVCGYALDIAGQMVDGVVVPKEQARVVFETEQRRGADPGLVEAVRGNLYRTRVYPVPARGSRTLRLTFVTALTVATDDAVSLELPMPAEHLHTRTLSVEVQRMADGMPAISGLAGAEVIREGADWLVRTSERDVTPESAVRVEMPPLPASLAMLERDEEGTVWFCVSSKPSLPVAESVTSPTSLTVLWDASGSRAAQDHTQEIELLRCYAATDSVRHITLVTFADCVRTTKRLASADDLVRAVQGVRYDGATNFQAVAQEVGALAQSYGAQEDNLFLLFSDGIETLHDEPLTLPGGIEVVAIASGRERDVEALRQACRGLAYTAEQAPKTAQELLREVRGGGRRGPWNLDGQGVADVCDASMLAGNRWVMLGRLTAPEATISFGTGEDPIVLSANEARAGTLIATAWASRRVALLAPRASQNASELLSLGRRFGVASPVTSLLVLESLEQWLQYNIEPPRTLAHLHEEWKRRKDGEMRLESDEARKSAHRRELASRWAGLLGWWKRDYAASAQPHGATYCPSCGSAMAPGTVFCPHCGAMVSGWMGSPEDTGSLPLIGESAPRSHTISSPMADDFGRAMPSAPMPRASVSLSPQAAVDAAAFEGEAADLSMDAEQAGPVRSVHVRPWMPNAPYLKKLDAAANEADARQAQDAYYNLRAKYCDAPSFFLDVAGWFLAHGDTAFGVSVLSNLAEMRIEDAALLRVMAWRLREAGDLAAALVALRRVLRLREEDSQSYRDLALVLSELARASLEANDEEAARAYAQEAGEHYRTCALTPWQRRPMAIGLFAVEEYNALRAWADAHAWRVAPDLPSLGADLEGVLACDLRITLAWDADETDVDLHVTEPTGEEAYYAHNRTSSGGRVSEDITDGYGPELYAIRKASDGVYNIRAHYYASHQQTVFGAATCTLTVYTDWGRPEQQQRITTTRLDHAREMVQVGTAAYGEAAVAAELEEQPQEGAVELGMSMQEVSRAKGEPSYVQACEGAYEVCWAYELAGARELKVYFAHDAVARIVEGTPWGDQMISC